MISSLRDRRAAEELAAVLDGTASPEVVARHERSLAVVGALRAVPRVEPRADFSLLLREQLMAAAVTELVPTTQVVVPVEHETDDLARVRRRRRRTGSLVAAVVLVGSSAGMAAAAAGSLPGEGLYPVKRAGESLQSFAQSTDAGRGRSLLDQAGTRISEVTALSGADHPSSTLVDATLADFRSEATSGADDLFRSYQTSADPADVTAVRSFVASQMAALAQTAAAADPRTRAQLMDAADVLGEIDQQARVLCADCGTRSPVSIPNDLALASGPASVDHLVADPTRQARVDLAAQRYAARLATLARDARIAQERADATPVKQVPSTPVAQLPVTSSLTRSGDLVPTAGASTDTAVRQLVSGVTTTVGTAVAPVTSATGGTLSKVTGSVAP